MEKAGEIEQPLPGCSTRGRGTVGKRVEWSGPGTKSDAVCPLGRDRCRLLASGLLERVVRLGSSLGRSGPGALASWLHGLRWCIFLRNAPVTCQWLFLSVGNTDKNPYYSSICRMTSTSCMYEKNTTNTRGLVCYNQLP